MTPTESADAAARAPLTSLPGVGRARADRLARLGLSAVRDLLFLRPRRLEEVGPRVDIASAPEHVGRRITIEGSVSRARFVRTRGKRSLLRIAVRDETGTIDALFFNQPWMKNRLPVAETVKLQGLVVDARGAALAHPRVESPERPLPEPGTLVPMYGLVDGIGQEFLRGLVHEARERCLDSVHDPVPAADLERLGLVDLASAVVELHAPTSFEAFGRALRRVGFEALLTLQARLATRERVELGRARAVTIDAEGHAELLGRFPFRPTNSQTSAFDALRRDLRRTRPMRRLLQGDVGAGKTLVGLYACMATARAGGQAAFLAPTEILAEQHYDGLRADWGPSGLRAALLTGSLSAAERKRVLAGLASGETDLVFGTHALFSDDVRYRRLATAVVDEQQRFGVAQRRRLLEKGDDVHLLLMTATPIPRTLALTLYGDLDTTVLSEKPAGRGVIRTRARVGGEPTEALEDLVGELEAGGRALWVLPRIESSDLGRGATEVFEALRASELGSHGIELVHGRMDAADRARRLDRFRAGKARVLVSTTVIEVGLDVPSATFIVIEGAERFGLAQLHQLRGRVGRGERPATCYLFGAASAQERLRALEATHNGFAIAEEDLRLRGMGDLAGLRQAGENTEGLADPELDLELILAARDLVQRDAELRDEYARAARAGEV